MDETLKSMLAQILGERYSIERQIGRGSFGIVYHAVDRMLERHVAVKVLLPYYYADPDILKRFLREARISAAIDHPNIVQIYDIFADERLNFFIMPFIRGMTIERYLKRHGAFPPSLCWKIARELCAALDYAHKKGIIHRDIKPANIILTPSFHPMITDFGIARALTMSRLTQSMVVGTPLYCSPEQWQGKSLDGRSDQYSLATVLYEMLTDQLTYDFSDHLALGMAKIGEDVRPIQLILPDLDARFAAVLMKALSRNPADRFDDVAAMRAALDEIEDLFQSRRVAAGGSSGPGEIYDTVTILFSSAMDHFGSGEYPESLKLLGRVLEIDPEHADGQFYTRLIWERMLQQDRVDELLRTGKAAFNNLFFTEAIQKWGEILELDDTHAEARALIQKARAHLSAMGESERTPPSDQIAGGDGAGVVQDSSLSHSRADAESNGEIKSGSQIKAPDDEWVEVPEQLALTTSDDPGLVDKARNLSRFKRVAAWTGSVAAIIIITALAALLWKDLRPTESVRQADSRSFDAYHRPDAPDASDQPQRAPGVADDEPARETRSSMPSPIRYDADVSISPDRDGGQDIGSAMSPEQAARENAPTAVAPTSTPDLDTAMPAKRPAGPATVAEQAEEVRASAGRNLGERVNEGSVQAGDGEPGRFDHSGAELTRFEEKQAGSGKIEHGLDVDRPPDMIAPVIEVPEGQTALEDEPFLLTVKIVDEGGVMSATLHYRVKGDEEYEKTTGIEGATDALWRFEIPAQGVKRKYIEFYVIAIDENGNQGALGSAGTPGRIEVEKKRRRKKAIAF